jgi:hypothetical protein
VEAPDEYCSRDAVLDSRAPLVLRTTGHQNTSFPPNNSQSRDDFGVCIGNVSRSAVGHEALQIGPTDLIWSITAVLAQYYRISVLGVG